jgi:hypothetical protein
VTLAAAPPKNPASLISGGFIAAITLSAALIFWIELLFPKMMLPEMGGAATTWVTALMFYQAVLLLGYGYTCLLTRWAPTSMQAMIHLTVLAAAAFVLPPRLPHSPAFLDALPVLHVLYNLTIGVGLPLFALAATAPLLQHCFSRTNHPARGDPYFLYAASNVGSLTALVACPMLIEPLLGGVAQTRLWTIGFLTAAGAIFACIALPMYNAGPVAAAPGAGPTAAPVRAVQPRWMWLLLAAVPSSLLSGTTMRVTTDVAAGPLFWVIPLALYLLTFVLAFSRRRLLPMRVVLLAQPVSLVPVVIAAFGGQVLIGDWPMVAATLILFFLTAYICHVRLADGRPNPERSTEFYLIVALGGLAGGAFNALVAPHIFQDMVEYPLALILAGALRPREFAPDEGLRIRDLLIPGGAGLAAVLAVLLSSAGYFRLVVGLLGLVFSVGLIAMAATPMRFAAGLAAAFLVSEVSSRIDPSLVYQERNFFGTVKVLHDRASDTNMLVNGSIVHGVQARDPLRRRELGAYYHAGGPYTEALEALAQQHEIEAVAVVGLGAGTIACSGFAEARWTFYEINPAVVRVASDPRYFSFMTDCQPHARILLGDGRLLLAGEQQKIDLIVLDAFSSDAVPTHLMTVEAFSMYLDKLQANGMILANISNRFVNLDIVLSAIATRLGLTAAWRFDGTTSGLARPSKWLVMARSQRIIARLADNAGWTVEPRNPAQPWTDDHSDLFSVLLPGPRSRP